MRRSMGIVAMLVGMVAIGIAACSDATRLPENFLGTWRYIGSSGGISGDGLGDEPAGYIELFPDRIEVFRDDGTRVGSSSFAVSRAQTIFAAAPQWTLTYENGITEVLLLSGGGDSISLSENVYDGISRGYARRR